jgi:2-phosphoglycerate kinase
MVHLLKKYKNILPFVIYISNEEKQKERFAVRSKYMTLDPKMSLISSFLKKINTSNTLRTSESFNNTM